MDRNTEKTALVRLRDLVSLQISTERPAFRGPQPRGWIEKGDVQVVVFYHPSRQLPDMAQQINGFSRFTLRLWPEPMQAGRLASPFPEALHVSEAAIRVCQAIYPPDISIVPRVPVYGHIDLDLPEEAPNLWDSSESDPWYYEVRIKDRLLGQFHPVSLRQIG